MKYKILFNSDVKIEMVAYGVQMYGLLDEQCQENNWNIDSIAMFSSEARNS